MIGRLRTRVGLYAAQTQTDDLGGAVTTWQLWGQAWVSIVPITQQERGRDGRASVLQTYKVIMRHRKDLPERLRLLWGERTLRVITASDPDNLRERLHLICEEEQQ